MINNKRLSFIVSLFNESNDKLLDVGTDHGYLIKDAFLKDKIKEAIATDINIQPLENAKSNLKGFNVKYYNTDGLKNIPDNYNTVVIAGMGGNLISNILNDAKNDKNITYFLQPNNKEKNLRKHLMDSGFEIIDEHVIFDKKYYVIIVAKRGKMKLSIEDLVLGPILKRKKTSENYYTHLIKWYKYIIDKHSLKEGNLVNEYNLIKKHKNNK